MALTGDQFRLRSIDVWAITLLVIGCGAGMLALILDRQSSVPSSQGSLELQLRVKELERRLLEHVPPSIEQRYRDL